MKRYLIILICCFSNVILAQEVRSKKDNITLKLVNKIDLSSTFNVTDNEVGENIKKTFEEKGLNFSSDDNRYFISVSFGWSYKRSTELQIDNYKGLIVDKIDGDKIIAEFSCSKTNNLERSTQELINLLMFQNEKVDNNGKFIDISDHFMKMNEKIWDSSRPDSHAPSSILADHTHPRGGIMLGYKFTTSQGENNYNGDKIFSRDEISTYYDRHVSSQKFKTHTLEFMYGLTDNLTIFSNLNYHIKESTSILKQNTVHELNSSGIGDIELQFLYNLFSNKNIKIHSNIGLFLPTGSISKEDNNDGILPYSMQIGNGHLSSVTGFTVFTQFKKFSAGIQPIHKLSLYENSRGYKTGNQISINYWAAINLSKSISISFRQNYLNLSGVTGEDSELDSTVMILNNKNNTGHILLNSALGFNFSFRKGLLKNKRISFEYILPTHMSYEGLQVGNFHTLSLGLQYSPGHMGH
jgi:hypothetical protein